MMLAVPLGRDQLGKVALGKLQHSAVIVWAVLGSVHSAKINNSKLSRVIYYTSSKRHIHKLSRLKALHWG